MICGSTLLSAVAPFTGAWIEIYDDGGARVTGLVAPFTGAWIEIDMVLPRPDGQGKSLPSRERGLKSRLVGPVGEHGHVAPFTGA